MNTFEQLILQGVHSACFSSFSSPFLYMCLEISFSIKSKVLLSFSLKKHLDGWFWTKSPGNGFLLKENYLLTICVFYFYFDCLYRKYKKQWKITFFWMLMKHKRFNFQFAYRSTKLFINWKLLSYCCSLQLEELYHCNIKFKVL